MSGWGGGVVSRRALRRPSPIFLVIVAVFVTSGWMAWTDFGNTRLDVFLFVASGWTVSLCLHEYAHAVLALRGGDQGVVDRGYLTLNPLRYAHPVLSIVLPLVFLLIGGIGLPGGAVWVDHHALSSRWARSLVSLAGPAANLLFAIVIVVPFAVGVDTVGHETFWAGLAFLGFLQLTAALLNLLPIPGVDGGNALEPWLDAQWRRWFAAAAPYGMLLLFALLFTPRISGAFFSVVDAVGGVVGLPDWLVAEGYRLFRFWAP